MLFKKTALCAVYLLASIFWVSNYCTFIDAFKNFNITTNFNTLHLWATSVFIIWLTFGWILWHCFVSEITHFPVDVGQIYGKETWCLDCLQTNKTWLKWQNSGKIHVHVTLFKGRKRQEPADVYYECNANINNDNRSQPFYRLLLHKNINKTATLMS